MQIRGVIFDLDGTLLDSMPLWDNLGARYLALHGISAAPELSAILFPMTGPQAARYLVDTYPLGCSAKQAESEITALAARFYRESLPLKQGAEALLRFLSEKGLPLCVLTATARELACSALRRTGVLPFFKEILSCGDQGETKEAPACFLRALQILKTLKEETLVVEDALYAVRTAKAAGFPVAAVYDASSGNAALLLRRTADLYLPSLDPDRFPPDFWNY